VQIETESACGYFKPQGRKRNITMNGTENTRRVYADNAATTAMSGAATEKMVWALKNMYGNPSSLHTLGQEAKVCLEEARSAVAACLGAADPREIIFTSGGSESDNTAIRSAAYLGAKKGKRHLISTAFEHHAVLHTLDALKKEGFEVTLLPVSPDGFVTAEQVRAAIRPDTALVSVMYANNEIGTVQPIREIGAVCRDAGVVFHTDAVQAVGHIPVDVQADCVDMLSLSAHKFHGPKGVGVLYVRRGIPLIPLIRGGAQERNLRAGTENLPSVLAMAAALEEAVGGQREHMRQVSRLRDRLIDGILAIPHTVLNGTALRDTAHRLPGTVNVCVEGIEGESLLLRLDLAGICASSGSACTSGSLEPSHVLLAIGRPAEIAHGSLRLSLSEFNTEEDVDLILEKLPGIVAALRDMSPVWEDLESGKLPHTI
jgi:cysteine desulfurase